MATKGDFFLYIFTLVKKRSEKICVFRHTSLNVAFKFEFNIQLYNLNSCIIKIITYVH